MNATELSGAEIAAAIDPDDPDRFATTPLFWDCECADDYIRRSAEVECGVCGAVRERQPDARVNEVVSHGVATRSLFEREPRWVKFA